MNKSAKRTFAIILAASSIVATAACSSTPPSSSAAPSAEVTTAASTPSSSAIPSTAASSASPESVIATQTKKKLNAQGIEVASIVKVKGGSYPQYKVSKDNHLATFEASRHTDGTPAGWTKADLQSGQTAAANYLMNVVLDNPTLNDYEANKGIFISQLKKVVDPKYSDFFVTAVDTGVNSVFYTDTFTDNFTGDNSKGFRYVSDGITPRISDITDFKLTSSQNYNGDVYYEYSGIVVMNVVDKNNNPYTMDNGVTYGVTVSKVSDKFLLSGGNFAEGKYMNPSPA